MPKSKARQAEARTPEKRPRGTAKQKGSGSPTTGPLDDEPKKRLAPGMDTRSRTIVVSLMGALLFVFILIAFLAPDATQPDGNPDGNTVVWRLLFLLLPLGVMYGLLWGEKLLKLVRR